MNTIAVLIPSFTLEYSIDVLSGIYDYFSDKDVKVIVAQTKFPHSTIGIFDYQYFTSVEFLKAQDVDAYIVVSGVFTTSISQQDLEDIVAQFAPRPVISIGADLSLPGTYSILADCNKSFSDIVKHLKEKHGCKKIAFFSANSTKSAEALERYDAFTTALEENDLVFYPDLVMDGQFNYEEAKKLILKRYSTKEDIDFDALVCANDLMAAGCMEALQQLGVKIPDDVKISGFDDAVVSKISSPKLSTINQAIYNQGLKAAELTDTLLNGKSIHKKNFISLFPKFRQSCGCISVYSSEPHFIDTEGKTCVDAEEEGVNLHQFVNELNERNKLITLMDTVRGSNTLKQFFYNLKYIAQQCDMSCIAVNFFKDVCYLDAEDNFTLPKKMNFWMLYDGESSVELFKPDIAYNPRQSVIPSRSLQGISGIFILHPVFSGESNYGYLLCKINRKIFSDYIVYLKIIVNTLAQSYEYTNKIIETEKLEGEKSALTRLSRTDDLTGILNRRGFIERGQTALDLMQETDMVGVVFFADMDGLKKINDTYGHEVGDLAIKTQAMALKAVFRSTDVVGRLSGDEFGIVAVGMNLIQVDRVRLKLDMMNEKLSRENNLPFTLSVSLGAVDLQKSSILKKLLSEADKSLYEEKRKKRHARLSENSK